MNKLDLECDINSGMSSHQISRKYNKGQTTIRYWLDKFGLKTCFKNIGNGYVYKHCDIGSIYEKLNWTKCQDLYDSGLMWRDLKTHGYTNDALSWAIKHKILKMRSTSESLKLLHKSGKINYDVYRTKKHREKMSKFGGYKENSGRCKHIKFIKKDGIIVNLQGSWENRLAEFLDVKNIMWDRNKIGYKYLYQNKEKLYFPDFYLKDFNVFIEVKGYETNKDKEKWRQFPFKLIVVKKKEIENLELWFQETFKAVISSAR